MAKIDRGRRLCIGNILQFSTEYFLGLKFVWCIVWSYWSKHVTPPLLFVVDFDNIMKTVGILRILATQMCCENVLQFHVSNLHPKIINSKLVNLLK